MIEASRPQISFAEGLIEEEVGSLWEPWMRPVDELLADPELLQIVYQALARRSPQSRSRGRPGTPAEVVLRLLLLKHIRNWSYGVLEREVRSNLVYRQFTRVGAEKVPDAKTLGKLAVALGPEVIEQLHARVVAIAREKQIIRGRRLRVDTTVVRSTSIALPQTYAFEREVSVIGAPFFIMEEVDGLPPDHTPSYNASGWLKNVEPARREMVWLSAMEKDIAQLGFCDNPQLALARPEGNLIIGTPT